MNAKVGLILMLIFLSGLSVAANLGNYGEVFPVIEEDIRKVIMGRLQSLQKSGELDRLQTEVQERVAEHIIRPKPLLLPTTLSPTSYYIDPTITVTKDIWAPNGLQVAKAGTRFNPFDVVTFSKTLFFFNADDKHQLDWVKKHYQDYAHVKFILTGGDIREAAQALGRIYFDLDGRLTKLLNIQHVPSVVNQAGRRWKIQEIGVNNA